MAPSLGEVGERGLVAEALRLLSRGWRCPSLGPGDDAACLGSAYPGLLLKIDGGSVEQNMAPWMSWRDLGWLMVAAAISDLAAKAARPLAVAVSVGLSPSLSLRDAVELLRGAAEAAEVHGAWLSGGDTNASPGSRGWVDVAAVGEAVPSWGPLARRPRVGDLVYTTIGRYGAAGAAWHSLRTGAWRSLGRKGLGELLSIVARPRARTDFAYMAAGLPQHCLTGSIDVSDGLAASLEALAEAAGARLRLERLPTPHPLAVRYSRLHGAPLEELVLNGGQEYEVVFTVRHGCAEEVEEAARAAGLAVEMIGRVEAGPVGLVAPLEARGWDNLLGG